MKSNAGPKLAAVLVNAPGRERHAAPGSVTSRLERLEASRGPGRWPLLEKILPEGRPPGGAPRPRKRNVGDTNELISASDFRAMSGTRAPVAG